MAQDDDEVDDDYEDNNQWLTPITIIIMIVIITKITIITMITFITFDKNQVSRPVARLRRSRFIPSAAYNDHTCLRFGCQVVTMMTMVMVMMLVFTMVIVMVLTMVMVMVMVIVMVIMIPSAIIGCPLNLLV